MQNDIPYLSALLCGENLLFAALKWHLKTLNSILKFVQQPYSLRTLKSSLHNPLLNEHYCCVMQRFSLTNKNASQQDCGISIETDDGI